MKIKGHLDLFSGIGGFSLGLKNAGVEPEWIGFSDIDKYANELFKRRFPNAEQLGTITDVSYKTLKGRQIDLLTGGFPCQAFSIAGKRQGFKDTRGTLFFDIQRLLQDYINNKSPIPCILLENVKGLYHHDNHRTFATIFRVLTNLNYTIECQLVNTMWVLPQNRERIYIFGRYNGNPSGRKVFPIRAKGTRVKQVFIDESMYRMEKKLRKYNGYSPTLNTSQGGGHIPLIREKEYNYGSKALNKTLKQNDLKEDDVKALDLYNRKAQDISPTLTEPHHNTLRLYDKSRIRRLTPIECERLQGFPDNWTDGQSDTQRYKQCGNAVSVPIVEMIMRKIYEQ